MGEGEKRAGLLAEVIGGIEENPFVPVNPEFVVSLHSLSTQLLLAPCLEGGSTLLILFFFFFFFRVFFSISAHASVLLLCSFGFSFPCLFLPLYVLLLPEKLIAAVYEGEALAIPVCTSTLLHS